MHAPARRPSIRPEVGMFLVAVLLLGLGVWRETSVSDMDEYWLSLRAALETWSRDSWWLPFVNGEPRLRKPPLLYWAMCGSFELLGPTLLAARLPGVLAGAGLVTVARALARRLRLRADLVGWMTLGALSVAVEARMAMLDLPLAFFTAWTVLLAWRALQAGTWPSWLAVALVAALGWMTKGPPLFLFLGGAALAGLLDRRVRARLARQAARAAGALAAFVALSAAWPLWVLLTRPEFLQILGEESTAQKFGLLRPASLGSVPGGLLLGSFPWTGLVLAALWRGLSRRRLPAERSARWLVLWVVLAALPFLSFMTFERYLIPLATPLVLLAARELERCGPLARRAHLRIAAGLVAIPAGLVGAASAWFAGGWFAAGLVASGLGIAFRQAGAAAPGRGLVPAPRTLAAVVAVALGLAYPALGVNRLPRDLPADLARRAVLHFDTNKPAMLSMRLRRSVQRIDLRDPDLDDLLRHYDGYLFLAREDESRLLERCRALGVPATARARFGSFYARTVFLAFARPDATAGDWLRALRARSLDSLEPEFVCYEVGPGAAGRSR